MPIVSAIIPSYNSAAFLDAALKSIFAQTLLPLEIIVVDDCSTDNTCKIVEQLQAESPVELRLIRMQQNSGGPVVPMNRGIQEARGQFIAILDHDDRMTPKRLELGATLLATSDSLGLVFAQSQGMNEHGALEPPRPQAYTRFGNSSKTFSAPEAFNSLITEGFGYGGAGGMMFRKAAWENIGGFRPIFKICWDYDFALRTTLGGWDVGYIPEVVYYHRRHEGNLEHGAGGAALYYEVAELIKKLRDDLRINSAQQLLLDRTLAVRAITAAQQQRNLGNHRLAQQFYREAWGTGAAYIHSLRGMLKNALLRWTRRA